MAYLRLTSSIGLLLPVLIGCFQPEVPSATQLERGYILLLPGVECTASSMAGVCRGLRDAGIDQAIDLDQWGYRPFGTFRNLPAYELNRKRAQRMADKLARYRAEHPSSPIQIVGFSGGGAMALFVAEALPSDVKIDRIVLMGAAISPGYDVCEAMSKCERGMVNFHSAGDWLMAGVATNLFGTMDRKNTSTAGRIGFRTQEGQLRSSPGLTQIAWQPEWRRLGHDGGHPGWLARAWAREMLAPQLRLSPASTKPGV
jgi:pimeloyl-ACP methyl ester carboxylesterase